MRNRALKTREIEPDVYLPFGRHVTDTVISLTTRALLAAITDPDPAASKRAFDAMMTMTKIDIAAIEAARRG